MAKVTGLGWTTCSCDNSSGSVKAIVNDVTNIQFALPRAVIDTTGMDKFAFERLLGLADYSGTLNGVFNPSANQAHSVFSDIGSTSVIRTLTNTFSAATLAAEVWLTDYQVTRSDSGELTWSVPFVLGDGTAPVWS